MNPADLTLSDAAGLIAARRLSPVELLEACQARIEGATSGFARVVPWLALGVGVGGLLLNLVLFVVRK